MTSKLDLLQSALRAALGDKATITAAPGEVTVVVKAADSLASMPTLTHDKIPAFPPLPTTRNHPRSPCRSPTGNNTPFPDSTK